MDAVSRPGTYNREQFIKDNLSFIRRLAAKQAGRMLEWGKDEELSIALIAFNSAIDAFEYNKSNNFPAFASVIIKRRLIDYYRAGSKHRNREFPAGDQIVALADSQKVPPAELGNLLVQERKAEIRDFTNALQDLGVELADLVDQAPQRKALRGLLHGAAVEISRNQELHAQILSSSRLPLTELSELTGVSAAILSKRRKYLLAILYIQAHSSEYPFISTYLNIGGY